MSTGPRYSIIPAIAVRDRRIRPRDLQVLCLLGSYTDGLGWCRRSQVRMADELDTSRDTLQRSIVRLVSAGYVEVRERVRADGGTAAHEYRVRTDVSDQIALDATAHQPGTEKRQPDTTDDDADPPPQESAPHPQKSAPPADPRSAPPADIEIGTHKNDPVLTTPLSPPGNGGAAGDVVPEGDPVSDGDRVTAPASGAGDEGDAEHEWRQLEGEWPTAAMDRIGPALSLWRTLPASDRRAALLAAAHFVRECRRAGRRVPGIGVYLRERRWERGGMVAAATAAAAAGDRVIVAPWSREWWAVWHTAAGSAPRRAATMGQQAASGGAYAAPKPNLPSPEALAGMASVPVGSPEWRAWDGWYHARRVRLPRPERSPIAFFPSLTPPEDVP